MQQAECVRKKKIGKKKTYEKSAPPKTHHETHISPATAILRDSARRNASHALAHTRPVRWIPGLWKSASCSSRNQYKRRMLHIHTDRHIDRRTDRPITLVERYMRQGCLVLAVGRMRSKQRKRKKNTKSHQTLKTRHEIYPQQPGDRDHPETACSETHPTR